MPSRPRPHLTPRAAVSSAFAISPAPVRGSLHRFSSSSAFRIPPSPVRANRADQPGPAAETPYCPLPPQQANDPRQRMFRGGLVTCGSPSTTRFVSTDSVLCTYLSVSGAGYPRLTVERAFHYKVDYVGKKDPEGGLGRSVRLR